MTRLSTVRTITLALVLLPATACRNDRAGAADPRWPVPVTYGHQGDLHWVRADGSEHRVLRSRSEKESPVEGVDRSFFDAWFHPHLDAGGTSVACVRIVNWSPGVLYQDPAQVDQWQELVVFGLEDGAKEEVIERTRQRLSFPVWSPDGEKIAWVQDQTALRCWERGGEPIRTAAALDDGRFLGWRWLDDDSLVAARESGRPRSGELIRVHRDRLDSRIDVVASWEGPVAPQSLIEDPESAPVFQALFGAAPDATSRRPPFFTTTDLRYSFCERKKEGFLARGWIEGFDAKTGVRFEVRTLWRGLYVE